MILYPETKRPRLDGFETLNLAKKKKRDQDLSLPQCKVCKGRYKDLRGHFYIRHMMTTKEYREWQETT